jgi:hypothetical protein
LKPTIKYTSFIKSQLEKNEIKPQITLPKVSSYVYRNKLISSNENKTSYQVLECTTPVIKQEKTLFNLESNTNINQPPKCFKMSRDYTTDFNKVED